MLQRNRNEAGPVLAFAQSLRGGGVERALLLLAGEWHAAGRRVTLAIGSTEGPLAAELPPGIQICDLGDGAYSAMLRALPAIIRETDPAVLFCPGNHYTAMAGFARLRLGRACPPIVGKVSNTLVRADMNRVEAWGYRRWLRLHPRFLDHVVAMSPGMAEEAVREMAIPRDRVSVIANPHARPRADAAPAALPPGRYLLGVGRLEPQKRWERAIAALQHLRDEEVALVILGEGSARAHLEAEAERLGLAGRVHLPGHASDPLPAIAGAAALLLTSDFEGVPGALREALSLGTPVIATDASVAVREIVASPALGTVVARGDAAALVLAIDHWLAPGAVRPVPVMAEGDPAADYLALFDRLAAQRSR